MICSQAFIVFKFLLLSVVAVDQFQASGVGCLRSETGSEYLGEQNVTSSGRPCVRWDEVQGAFRDYIRITFLALPDRNASNAKNFCRNPNNDSRGVWCFVNLLGNVQFCNVPRCVTSTLHPPSSTTPGQATGATAAGATSVTAPSTVATTTPMLATQPTMPAIRHSVVGWDGEETPAIDETISDYVKPVVMSNNFEELSAALPAGVVTNSPSTPNTIYLTLKQTGAGFGMELTDNSPSTTTMAATTAVNQVRPFDAWEEDPRAMSSENSVSADDSWHSTEGDAGLSDKIYSEDAGTVKVRTGGNLLSGKKDMEGESTKVVIQRSSHLSSSASSCPLSSYLLLIFLVTVYHI